VRDNRSFDPVVQLFGRAGYAVLQVNYRGSLGYGRAFRDAAFGAVGGAIEADLIGALEQVLRDDRLDPARVCAVGMSYGGYSALMLAIARPEMLRCVAAYAPLTDLPLRFGSSDWNADPLQRSVQQALYGDPATELTSLQQRSPLYRFQELTQPLLLGHGLRDRRVHPEHSARLELVLRESGRPPAIHWYDNEAHGLNRVSNQIDWYGRVLAFLRRELGT
jgi:dipeptidyl aminopeptidase/acylaminoacyl peptidase